MLSSSQSLRILLNILQYIRQPYRTIAQNVNSTDVTEPWYKLCDFCADRL